MHNKNLLQKKWLKLFGEYQRTAKVKKMQGMKFNCIEETTKNERKKRQRDIMNQNYFIREIKAEFFWQIYIISDLLTSRFLFLFFPL